LSFLGNQIGRLRRLSLRRYAVTTTVIAFFGGAFASSPAWAQAGQTPRANGPFANLFGANSAATHGLDLHGYLFESYQDVLLPPQVQQSADLDPLFQRSQAFGGATAALNYHYNRRGDHSFINVAGFGSASDYSIETDRPLFSGQASASAGLSGQITPKVRAAASASASYSPYRSLTPFSSFGADPTFINPQFGFAADRGSHIPVNATAQISDQFSRRSTLSANVQWEELFALSDTVTGSEGWSGDIRYTRRVYRRLSVYGGYRYSEYRFSGNDNVQRNQGADAGFNYGDSLTLQLGRRTYASFFGALTGATVTNGTRGGSTTFYALTGTADIQHSMGRTWNASAVYNRHLGFNALFTQPILSDSVAGIISGQFAPRLNWNGTVAWMHGRVGLTGGSNVSTSYASSTLTLGLGRTFGLYAQYLYYRYEMPLGFTTFNLPVRAARQVASVGLTLSVPIFRHNARSPRDSR
jgi:hypothetical protein